MNSQVVSHDTKRPKASHASTPSHDTEVEETGVHSGFIIENDDDTQVIVSLESSSGSAVSSNT